MDNDRNTRALRQRCAASRALARRSSADARRSIHNAYAAAREVDDECAEDAIPVELDADLASTVEARRRCEREARDAEVAASRTEARTAERAAQAAERHARTAAEYNRRVQQLAREALRNGNSS